MQWTATHKASINVHSFLDVLHTDLHKLLSFYSDSVLAALDHPKDSHDSNVILHSIELQQYIEEMRQLIASSVDVSSSLQNRVCVCDYLYV